MELTLIVTGLLAAAAGLAVAVACALRAVAAHRHGLAAAGMRAAGCSPARRLLTGCEPLAARIRSRVTPGWFFSFSAVLGLSVIALAAAVAGTVAEDVTDGDGVAVLDRPVAAFVAARRTGALTVVIGNVRPLRRHPRHPRQRAGLGRGVVPARLRPVRHPARRPARCLARHPRDGHAPRWTAAADRRKKAAAGCHALVGQ